MKRVITVVLTALLTTVLLSGCAEKGELNIVYGETVDIQLKKEYESLSFKKKQFTEYSSKLEIEKHNVYFIEKNEL